MCALRLLLLALISITTELCNALLLSSSNHRAILGSPSNYYYNCGKPRSNTFLTSKLAADDNCNDDENDENDENENQQPYRNRSLVWTNKFRNLIPYETARERVIAMGFTSKTDWNDILEDGGFGPYVPNHPDEMYVDDWVSWDEFLGIRRTHDDAMEIVQRVLQLRTVEEYTAFVQKDPKRAECLRVPLKPHIVYKDKGWVSYDHFFGTMQ